MVPFFRRRRSHSPISAVIPLLRCQIRETSRTFKVWISNSVAQTQWLKRPVSLWSSVGYLPKYSLTFFKMLQDALLSTCKHLCAVRASTTLRTDELSLRRTLSGRRVRSRVANSKRSTASDGVRDQHQATNSKRLIAFGRNYSDCSDC